MKKFLFFVLAIIILAAIWCAYIAYQTIQLSHQEEINIPAIENISSIEDIVKPYIENDKTKALSIGLYQNGNIKYYNFGIASNKNPILPTKHVVYEIGSITKTFTTAVLAQMVQEGKVQFKDPISKYLPKEIINWSTDTTTITLEELASHTSGLPRMPNNFIPKMILHSSNPYKYYTQEDLYDYIQTYTPKSKPKRKVAYSNLGMGLLGNILTKIDAASYEEILQKRIFQPLGMNHTFIEKGDKTMITGHNGKGKPVSNWDIAALAGAGAIRSNTVDMMAYLKANIENQSPFAETHLPRAQKKKQEVGLAWWLAKSKTKDLEMIWHNGGTGGFRSYMGFSKKEQIGVVVLSNTTQSVDNIGIRALQLLKKKTVQETGLVTE